MIESYSKAYWACRRGMLELDLLLQPFCKEMFNGLSERLQQSFQELLTYDDPDLYRWLIGAEAPTHHQTIIKEIRQHAYRTQDNS